MERFQFQPRFVPLTVTKQRIVRSAGLGTIAEAFDQSPLKPIFEKALPKRVSPRSLGAYRLGLIQVLSLVYGHDCLDDIEEFRQDPYMSELLAGDSAAARTMGDFLRDFEDEHLVRLNRFLATQSKAYRVQLEKMKKRSAKPSLAPHLTIDSTAHVQQGTKMEGLDYNYKGEWGLDSQILFDELGFAWDMELRSGSTRSGVGASEQIRRAFSSYKFRDEKYLSGDAAYCYQEVITTCISLGIKFTFTAHEGTTGWESYIPDLVKWQPWQYTKEEKEAAAKTGRSLPEVDLSYFYWRPSWNDVLRLPIVVKRTKVQSQEQMILGQGEYKYYAVVTNLNLAQWSLQKVIEHHNERGNAENFIREEKYGFDLKHFPCQSLKANHAYGLLALVAHNILRWMAIHDDDKHPKFSKAIRRKFIYIPAKLVSHARTLVLKVSEAAFKEVNRIREALGLKLYPLTPVVCSTG